MKKILTLTFVVATFVLLAGMSERSTAAQSTDTQNNSSTSTPQSQPKNYDYTTKADDSYSVLARKAIQTYGINHKVNLAGSQIIFAETGMTQEAGSPELAVGQKVSISESTVKAWIEKAQKLSDTEKQAWNYYVQFVNFNTNSNG